MNVKATIAALDFCLERANFAECLLLTNKIPLVADARIRHIQIKELNSAESYSMFILDELAKYIKTDFCLLIQWDGHIINAHRWSEDFLQYDYIGASWPQFNDGYDVGNGGFSLRSKRLLDLTRDMRFIRHHPEDTAIGRINRDWLEAEGLHFAPKEVADAFSAERAGDPNRSFGYHGVFNMPKVLGAKRFAEIYPMLDSLKSIDLDFYAIVRQVIMNCPSLAFKMIRIRLLALFGR